MNSNAPDRNVATDASPSPKAGRGAAEQYARQFADARLGLFVHFGVYSAIGRGEWALNREGLSKQAYRDHAERFTADRFDADALARLAVDAGCRYLTFTTMHHDGFALYDSQVVPFNSVRLGPKRDLVAEVVGACRRVGLRVHLYHSLNNWTAEPDAVDALERAEARERFVEATHRRLEELVSRFNPIDCLWYDGWWPFDAAGWRAEWMNERVRAIQPWVLFNNRNGLPGDFTTPEQHLSRPRPHRPWEACVTHNENWGYHAGDHEFKTTRQIVSLLTRCAAGGGNLLLNVGPDGSGTLPEPSRRMLAELGDWMRRHGEAIYGSDPADLDWFHHGLLTRKANTLFVHLLHWPGETFRLVGIEGKASSVRALSEDWPLSLEQDGPRLTIRGLPAKPTHPIGHVLAVEFDAPPRVAWCAGNRRPNLDHPPYDPTGPA